MSGPTAGFVLPVDKPVGPTSHDVVAIARRALGIRRVGHTGTLDPFASGLLLLCFGPATRLVEYLTGLDKTYEAEALLGIRTDTEDLEGAVVDRNEGWRTISRDAVESALGPLRGSIEQVPPQYSAKKVDGVAMHRRARRGEVVELAARPVTIHDLELLSFDPPRIRFRVRCSSGTYVRSLARDLGDGLGVGAHLVALRRTRIGTFDVADSIPLDSLSDPDRVRTSAVTPVAALGHLPRVEVGVEDAHRLGHGRALSGPLPGATSAVGVTGSATGPDPQSVVVTSGGHLVAICSRVGDVLRPTKVFAS